jgi:hypothetical protein
MTEQPESLRLADWLERDGANCQQHINAAEELRRQHAEIERLTKFCDDLICELSGLRMAASMQERIDELKASPSAQGQWVGLTDEEENSLIPDPDGSAEANVRSVEILPGAWGKEYEEVDAWSEPLVLQMLRDHEAKLRQKNT